MTGDQSAVGAERVARALHYAHEPIMLAFAGIGLFAWVFGISTAAESAAISAFAGVSILAVK